MPHHLRAHEWCGYREGVVVADPAAPGPAGGKKGKKGVKKFKQAEEELPSTSRVEAGFATPVTVPLHIPLSTRVTLKFPSGEDPPYEFRNAELEAKPVAADAPRKEGGYYWGYNVRVAKGLSDVFTECPYDGGYDVSVGTSERGKALEDVVGQREDRERLGEYEHLLVCFGGVGGLEVAVQNDEEFKKMGVTEPEKLFDYWVDLCPDQGSRTIRTEEAIWLGLMGLRGIVLERGRR